MLWCRLSWKLQISSKYVVCTKKRIHKCLKMPCTHCEKCRSTGEWESQNWRKKPLTSMIDDLNSRKWIKSPLEYTQWWWSRLSHLWSTFNQFRIAVTHAWIMISYFPNEFCVHTFNIFCSFLFFFSTVNFEKLIIYK